MTKSASAFVPFPYFLRPDFMAASSPAPKISVATLAIMNVTTVVSLGGLPSEAKYGLSAVFYYLFAAVFFLIPVALVAAELSTGWPEEGGVFRWVSEAFGSLWGLIAVFALWMSFTILFPSCLIYGASALAFAGPNLSWDEALAANKHYVVAIVLALYWIATLISLRGTQSAVKVAGWGGVAGTLIPAALLIVFGVAYYVSGRPMYVDIAWRDFFPDFANFDSLVLAAEIFLCYAGIEMNAIHVAEIDAPARNYPVAIMIASLATVAIYALGTLTIALIIQPGQIDLTQSLLITYRDFFNLFGLQFMEPALDVALTIGAFSAAVLWISGPSRALTIPGKAGFLPPVLQKVNAYGVPANLLLVQGALVTLLCLMFVLMPSVQATFQILNQLCTILYLAMYLLMFAAAIRLRYSHAATPRPFTVPGGMRGMWLVAGSGILAALGAFVVSFMPPSQVAIGDPALYSLTLLASFAVALAVPVGLYFFARPGWKPTHDANP